MLEIRLLGQFNLKRNGASVDINARSAQSLLGYLVLNTGIIHRREKLAGMLWPDATEPNARSYLRKALWQVRKSLAADNQGGEEYLLSDDISISFNSNADYWLDVDALGNKPIKTISIEEQIEAVSAYQGDLLPGFYEEWVTLERERIRAVFENQIQFLLERLIEQNRWTDTLNWGERWIALGSMPEPAYRALMVAHAALGDNAKVAATYERCVQKLQEELGVEPSEQTKELFEQLSTGKVIPGHPSSTSSILKTEKGEADSPSLESGDRRITNLPIPLTSFIGREEEIKETKRLLMNSRLLTLAGAGGTGKTRLAIQVANEIQGMFNDGIWWVELADLADSNLVPQAAAKALRVREASNQTLSESIADALHSKDILLVLDSCEHLLDACARLTEYLLKGCPDLKIMVTSREVLGIPGERVFHVPTLSAPDPDLIKPSDFHTYDAVRLFIDRAAIMKPDFTLTEKNAMAIGRLCYELDGIPLAIELAAARVQALRIEQIAARLDDRFRLLTGGSRTALPRHQTLLATLDWSYDLLTEKEQKVLQRLSVFNGGWSVAAAEAVGAGGEILPDDVLDILSLLTRKSLVLAQRRPGEEARYRMLETIRDYASVKLANTGEELAACKRHLDFFVMLAEVAEPQLFKPDQVSWFIRLETDHENLRAAAVWSLEQEAAKPALRLVGALSWFWYTRGHYYEARELSLQILSSPFAKERTAARAKALSIAGLVQWALGRKTNVNPLLEEALDIATEIRDRSNIAWTRVFLGIVTSTHGDHRKGLSLLEQGLEEYQALDSAGKYEIGFAMSFLGDGYFSLGEYHRAQELYENSVDVLSEVRDHNLRAYALRRLGHTARYLGDLEEAENRISESLTLNVELGHKQAIAACISGFACIFLDRGNPYLAVQLFAAVETQLEMIWFWLMPSDSVEFEQNLTLARSELGENAFTAAWAEGRSMTTKQAIELALKQTSAKR
ncbi:MAG: tetratricopeptide repeat protein [Chloroflexota bacterium]|nr:MAG: tetratricopeptide repeat protein [Chloroflexota bacterium]